MTEGFPVICWMATELSTAACAMSIFPFSRSARNSSELTVKATFRFKPALAKNIFSNPTQSGRFCAPGKTLTFRLTSLGAANAFK